MTKKELGVNVDHIATLRQARGTSYPDPVMAAMIAEKAGADGITVHLREDRRHIQDKDVMLLQTMVSTKVNLEMAVTEEMMAFACQVRPKCVCLVPEKREELTTEGGLAVVGQESKIKDACDRLCEAGIEVSLFIDPDPKQLDAAKNCGAPVVELHTGAYADAEKEATSKELERIAQAAEHASGLGFKVNAGHGLHYENVAPIVAIDAIVELNIGHAIIARAAYVGIERAVSEMKALLITS